MTLPQNRRHFHAIWRLFLLLIICFNFNQVLVSAETTDTIEYSRGRIVALAADYTDETDTSGGFFTTHSQMVDVLVIKGLHLGETVRAQYELNTLYYEDYQSDRLKIGDEVLLYFEDDENGYALNIYVVEVARDKHLLYLAITFCVLLILIGRVTGLKAIISLAFTGLAVVYVLLPAILKGWDPVYISVLICIAIIIISLLIISGFSRKTLAAIIGTSGGVIVAGVLALIIGTAAKMTDMGSEESQMLMNIPQKVFIDFRGLLFAGILIGTMGATMDVGMSIASAMHELRVHNPKIKTGALIRAGMNVGRDTMATMSNTLILAYTGGSMQLMILMMAYQTPFAHIINWDMIASEVLRALAGSIGVIVTVPITALAAGLIEEYKRKAKPPTKSDYGMY